METGIYQAGVSASIEVTSIVRALGVVSFAKKESSPIAINIIHALVVLSFRAETEPHGVGWRRRLEESVMRWGCVRLV